MIVKLLVLLINSALAESLALIAALGKEFPQPLTGSGDLLHIAAGVVEPQTVDSFIFIDEEGLSGHESHFVLADRAFVQFHGIAAGDTRLNE